MMFSLTYPIMYLYLIHICLHLHLNKPTTSYWKLSSHFPLSLPHLYISRLPGRSSHCPACQEGLQKREKSLCYWDKHYEVHQAQILTPTSSTSWTSVLILLLSFTWPWRMIYTQPEKSWNISFKVSNTSCYPTLALIKLCTKHCALSTQTY